MRCRGFLATHFHQLADANEGVPSVSLKHMACQVSDDDSGAEQVRRQYCRHSTARLKELDIVQTHKCCACMDAAANAPQLAFVKPR